MDKVETLAEELGAGVSVGYIDVSKSDCTGGLQALMDDLDGVDLIIISAGCGFLNPMHDDCPDLETVSVNVLGFMVMAQAAFRNFKKRGRGHLAVITSVAALRGSGEATVYAASKAFQSIFLDGLVSRRSSLNCRLPLPNYNPVLWTRR
jgi:short-subunit dehydrogenase